MITVNNVDLEFSLFNPEHVSKYDTARKTIGEKYAAIRQADTSEGLEDYIRLLKEACCAIFDFFDGTFGQGTSDAIFGAECDFEKCIDAYVAFEEGVQAQSQRFSKKLQRFAPNRATRRAAGDYTPVGEENRQDAPEVDSAGAETADEEA